MMARVPIRWRLTLWYAGFFAAAMILLGGGLYIGLRDRLYESLDEQLAAQATEAESAIRSSAGGPGFSADLTLIDDDAFVRLLDRNGAIVAETGAWPGQVPAAPEPVTAALAGRAITSSLLVEDEPLRVLTRPVIENGSVSGAIQVGLSSEDVSETLRALLSLLTIGTLVLLLAGIGGGYLLAGRVLSPVAEITRLAGRIDDRDLQARLRLDLPDDELGRLARTFDTMLDRIEDGFERQRRFTGDAAHELRTPLSLMRGQVDLALARSRNAGEYRDALRELDLDLERLARLVGTLLTLARADADQLVVERAWLDLAETVRVVLDQYDSLAAAQDVTLVDQTSPAPLEADEGMMIQILVNLLDNALAHTPAGGEVTIGCRVDGEWVRLRVADTGPGIAPERRARVFDRLYRVDAGRARQQGGAGLGLAIARALVEAHGGRIALTDDDQPGACIEVLLPASSTSGQLR